MRKEVSYAFKQSLPVMLGYLFLGMAYGLLLQHAGFGPVWAFITSLLIYAGSMQFVLVSFLTEGVSLVYAAVMTFFVNGRHIFYGLTFIEKFRQMGRAYPYMVFSLTDETYSVLCDLKAPEGMNEKKTLFWVSLFDHGYWVLGSVLGGVAGEIITFDTTGIDFSMTALFVVIVVNQWLEHKEHRPALVGLAAGILCLLCFGADRFLLPALCVAAVILLGVRKRWDMQ
ncbi:MAG: AzlC family ABC transporter permease [Roseburia sp.]|nr:AzlC family ABC transporter permease [Roseburia sp.]